MSLVLLFWRLKNFYPAPSLTGQGKNTLSTLSKCDMVLQGTHCLDFMCMCVRSYDLFFMCFHVNDTSNVS